jgi:anaerobic ribonucleoside-triphosphate reductase activating protein
MNTSLRIAGIENDSIVDGPGIRLAVFLQGCDKDCEGCHNQEARKIEGGTEVAAEDILRKIDANPLLTGVTLSGGEPLLQARALIPLASAIKERGLDLAIYTGDTLEQILDRNDPDQIALLKIADTLIDGPFLISERSLAIPFRGSKNQRILDSAKSIAASRPLPECDPDWTAADS